MLPPLPVDILHVLLLNMAAIQEHGAAEVSRSRGADNLAPETLFHQVGDISRVIDVGVRQHHGLNAGGIKEEIPVPLAGLLTLALIEAAIEEEAFAVHRDQMLRTGYRLDGAVKTDLHQVTSTVILSEPTPSMGAEDVLGSGSGPAPELKAAYQALGI